MDEGGGRDAGSDGRSIHVTRPRVSDVVNHKVEKFTIDALVSMLGAHWQAGAVGGAVGNATTRKQRTLA